MFDPKKDHKYAGGNDAVIELLPRGARTILDVGCGCGGTAAKLESLGKTVDGVTWSDAEAAQAAKWCRSILVADVSGGLPESLDGPYDSVICSHLLEHIAYPQKLLSDIRRVLKPGGALVVAIPNIFFWEDRLKLLAGVWEYKQSGTFDYTHLRWYSVESMHRLLKEHGFVADEFIADGWFPAPGLLWLLGRKLRTRLNAAAAKRWPGLFGKQLRYRVFKPLIA
ncbi:class I SAM-dependent methyltransferase [Prosthecobacter sp.]|uniref:class I SAM-dependent methyltransferase n=1 Tax=Prosthecobacter sp. TaxID=1965333 RepID=UPI0037839937